ncbi:MULTISPECIES: hypothetical protein [Halolamina]|uniref:Roadblock/LAMTOR2 domain-containing protein n=1 Tax=Halolamina pelagica TaxID=699431 RepID=A0A1I5P169_9EURY|nr:MULTISPECIES: hypothetical protein [Halolamina]NHX36555.1 hypothetical protein [Halolamina sp. R1-12]SFP27251.1 hypothetical protein SAMN05216277_102273 [Halolamina pelagica]
MSELDAEPIHTALADRLGTALRGVIVYDGTGIDHSLRADVADQYTEEAVRSFVDNSIVHQLDAPTVEESFELGSLEAVVRTFERSWVVRVADGPKRGCLFSVERDEDVTMAAVEDGIEIVQDVLPE